VLTGRLAGVPDADVRIEPLDPARWAESFEVTRVVFAAPVDPAVADAERAVLDDERVLVAVDPALDDSPIVASSGSYRFEVTLPGGDTIDAAGVTNVGVLPTHRRRGIFSRLLAHQHEEFVADGLALAVLNASEANIYGRLGYGMASRLRRVRVRAGASFAHPAPRRRLQLLRAADARHLLPTLYDAARRIRPGTLSRSPAWWDMFVGPVRMWKGGGHHEVVVAHPDGDDPGGYAMYTATSDEADRITVAVREVVAATPGTHAALWRYLLDIDLADTVEAAVPLDDPLLWRLADPRAFAVHAERDFLFARVLDTPAALAARCYSTDVDVVLDVADPFRPDGAAAGRFRLGGSTDGATCESTDAPADLALDVSALGSLLLGGVDASVLAAADRIVELRPGGVEVVATAFGNSPLPFCATNF